MRPMPIKRMIPALLIMILTVSLLTCDLLTPEEYESSLSTIASLDDRACDLLTREYHTVDTIMTSTDTTIVYDTLYVAADAITNAHTLLLDSLLEAGDQSGSVLLADLFDSVALSADTLLRDTTNMVTYSSESAYLFLTGEVGEWVAFVGWAFTGNNVSDYTQIDIIDRDGNRAEMGAEHMPLSTISGCIQEYLADAETGEIAHSPAIKSRSEFAAESKPYLVRLQVTQFIDGTPRVPLHITLLEND